MVQDINIGKIAESLNYKIDLDGSNSTDDTKNWINSSTGGTPDMIVMEVQPVETERVVVQLEKGRCLDKDLMFVYIDKIPQEPSTYSLSEGGSSVRFDPPVPANASITLRWFDTDVGLAGTSFIATDEEMEEGIITNKVPNVAQVKSELGKAPVGVKSYDSSIVYNLGDVVISSSNDVVMYKSLVDNNVGHALSEVEFWEEISLGGGVDLNTGDKVYDWIGTLEEYKSQDIENLHPEYLCFIVDDNVETKQIVTLPVGFIGQTVVPIDESLDLQKYANGQLIFADKFPELVNKLKKSPNLLVDETTWQAEKNLSVFGQCGKFVLDEVAGTIRLPLIINAQGLTDLNVMGSIENESLPNITGRWPTGRNLAGTDDASLDYGCFNVMKSETPLNHVVGLDTNWQGIPLSFDASGSSSAYQDNAPVQQEAILYPYFIQVANEVDERLPAIREYKLNNPHFFGQSMWTEVDLNNASWLLSNGSFHSGRTYVDYYNWLVEQHNNPNESNIVKAGSVTDNNGVLSGFSATNNVLLPATFSPANNPWEIVIKFKTPQTFTEQGLISKTHQNGMNYGLRIGFDVSGMIYYLIGSSYNTFICEGMGVQTLNVDTNYYVKFEFTGEAYKAYISTDTESWTEDFSFNTTTPIESFDEPTYLGDNRYKNVPFAGSIDLNESYININGQRWWNGCKSKVVTVGELSVSPDYDFVINTADQTFRLPLKTKLASGSAVVGNGLTLGLQGGSSAQASQIGLAGNSSLGFVGYPEYYGADAGSVITNVTNGTVGGYGVTTDPEKSGIETSSAGLKLYYYVGDVVQDASLINAGAVLSDVAELKSADFDQTAKEKIVGWGMPDYSAGIELNTTPYTATYKCWASVNLQYSDVILSVNEVMMSHNISSVPTSYNAIITQFIPLDVGDVLSFSGANLNISAPSLCIYPCKGV